MSLITFILVCIFIGKTMSLITFILKRGSSHDWSSRISSKIPVFYSTNFIFWKELSIVPTLRSAVSICGIKELTLMFLPCISNVFYCYPFLMYVYLVSFLLTWFQSYMTLFTYIWIRNLNSSCLKLSTFMNCNHNPISISLRIIQIIPYEIILHFLQ